MLVNHSSVAICSKNAVLTNRKTITVMNGREITRKGIISKGSGLIIIFHTFKQCHFHLVDIYHVEENDTEGVILILYDFPSVETYES